MDIGELEMKYPGTTTVRNERPQSRLSPGENWKRELDSPEEIARREAAMRQAVLQAAMTAPKKKKDQQSQIRAAAAKKLMASK